MAENAVLFISYNSIQKTIRSVQGTLPHEQLSLKELCVAGGVSGAVVSFVLTPIELLKCRLQTQAYLGISKKKHSGPSSLFMHTIKSRGIGALYQGHTATLLREVAGGVAWFGVYEYTVGRMIDESPCKITKRDLSPWQLMGAGALAGMAYNAALYPADVIKSRMQSGLHGKEGFLSVARHLYSTQGHKVFFRGFGITVARSAPSSGVIFLTYELLARFFAS